MKKICFLLAICFVLGLMTPCAKAEASTISQSIIDSAITLNYGVDNICIWQYRDDQSCYYMYVELTDMQEYGSNYYHDLDRYYRNPWYVAYYEGSFMLVTPSWWWSRLFKYDIASGTWSVASETNGAGHGRMCVDNGYETVSQLSANTDRYIVYASQDVRIRGGSLDGQAFFTVPSVPMKTELAEILEESKPQVNLTRQVIYLLPLSLSLVVSFLGLRKLLSLLRTTLFQA